MCAIAGILHPEGSRTVDARLLDAMARSMTHRGPDDQGILVAGHVGLVHRRLSIVDLAGGHQPMQNEDGSHHIVFNGEIYNHAEHRADLRAKGHVFATHCDTEAIVHLYEEYGERCVHYLRGMFAFAIWNQRARELFVARDRLGVKPLYYVHGDDGSFFFASEVKALLAANAVRPAVHVAALPEFLANRATSGDTTMFAGVRQLPPGHTLRWKDGKVNVARYWDARPGDVPDVGSRSSAELIDEWRELFKASVRLRLMSDVPLGLFLSGGVDSSAIAGVMSLMVSEPIKTFSVGFNDSAANELEYARLAARAFQTDHHEVLVEPSDFAAALPHLIRHEDEPLGHPASVPLYFVSQLAQRHVKVVLTGEGSDELLAGYYRYRTTLLNLRAGNLYHRFTTDPLRRLVRAAAARLAPASLEHKLPRTFLWRSPDVDALYFDNFAVFSRGMQRELLSRETQNNLPQLDPHGGMRNHFDAPSSGTLLQRLLYADLKTYLHKLLIKQDKMSMAASIESRVPFLDHKLVEFSTALPDRLKLRGWTTKYILRKSTKGLVPDAILDRAKMGFPVPLTRWFRGQFRPLLDEFVLGKRAVARGLFQPECLKRLVEEHGTGRADHTERLWALLNLEMWQRHFIDGEPLKGAIPQIDEARPAG